MRRSVWSCSMLLFLGVSLLAACADDDTPGDEPAERNVCGNELVEGFEQCDDGNEDPGDGCHECVFYVAPSGEPLDVAADESWHWFPFEGAACRDGSIAGLSLNLAPDAKGLVVYFEGGGACFESLNCSQNPASIAEAQRHPRPQGIFERSHPQNPFGDWSYLYLPYCSGDVFSGVTGDVTPPGMRGPQQFMGAENMQLFLDRVVPTIGGQFNQVLVTGISAGGISALTNAFVIGRAFPEAELIVLDDGGPPLSTDVVPRCLQKHWRELWGFESTILADCGAACLDGDDYMLDLTSKVARNYRLGVFSFEQDATVRLLYSFGQNECAFSPIPFMDAQLFEEGLYELRTTMRRQAEFDSALEFASYYAPGDTHTCIQTGCFYDMVVNGVSLTTWVSDLLAGKLEHVGQPAMR